VNPELNPNQSTGETGHATKSGQMLSTHAPKIKDKTQPNEEPLKERNPAT